MKRLFLIMAVLAILITTVFASQNDPRIPSTLEKQGVFPTTKQNDRFMPTYNFAIEPVSIVDNYYDFFPGSYNGKPVQRVSTPTLDGNWMVFQTKTTPAFSRRIYRTFIDNTGTIIKNGGFNYTYINEGFPGMAVTAGGKPILAYHVNMDEDQPLKVGFGYYGNENILHPDSDLYKLIDNYHPIEVAGEVIPTNEFIWPSVQIGPSPLADHQRVYILGKNSQVNGVEISENVIIYYKDFTEDTVENYNLDNTDWSYTTIPQLDAWNTSQEEWRRPFMSFIVHEDKLCYIGYHLAYTGSDEGGLPIHEGTTTAFVCDNYGEGEWTQYSTFNSFAVENPTKIDPYTGNPISGGVLEDQNGIPYENLFMTIGQSGHFSSGIDSQGRIHFPAFYTIESEQGTYFSAFHTVKNIAFNIHNLEWEMSEVFPQLDNGSSIPNPPTNITNYDGANGGVIIPENPLWLNWDTNGDGLIDQVYDDGTWDGIDDGITPADTDYWGVPITNNKWPFMYWDEEAADEAMMSRLHTAHITDGNDEGMMAMIWQDSEKSRLYNLEPDSYPELADYQNMCELVISVSADNGRHWSEPIFLNGVDTPEMQGHIPSFPYLGNKVDFIGVDENGDKTGRVYIMYLDDNTYGSSVQDIGQATGGSMEFMALDIVFTGAPTDNTNNDVVPSISMLSQNYPNPFNPETRINFNVVKSGNVELNIYNVKGQLVKTLVNGNKTVGSHNVVWHGDDNNGRKVSSGVYFYRVTNAGRSEMKKMVLMK